jgi:periplasmic divalent cation tolerance protein
MMEASGEFCFLYSTFPDAESAHAAARAIIEKKLAACVNVYPPMTSFYVWQNEPEEAKEVAAFIKTRRALVPEAMEALRELHPYATPCFLVLPIEGGNSDYLAWAREQTDILPPVIV